MELFSLSDIKIKNLSDVYHYIYHNPKCSKQGIATALSMSLPTVTQHLSSLTNECLIEKCGQISSSVGRRANAYHIIANARLSVGIEILPHKIYIVALNLYGKLEARESIPLNFHSDDKYFEELKNIVMEFLVVHRFNQNKILGIGLGIQGLTSPDGTTLTYGEIINCTGLSVEAFARHFSVPCRFIHDAECAAYSELWENPEIKNAVYQSLTYHLGGAIIINGELYGGLSGKSGTFEHMTLIPNGLVCYCGKKGCAECYCSGVFLLEENTDFEEFFEKKNHGDAACNARWQEYLDYLSMLINNIHVVIDSTIILGGHIASYFSENDLEYVRKKVFELSTFRDPTDYIVLEHCPHDAVSKGAALPFIKEFLNKIAQEVTKPI